MKKFSVYISETDECLFKEQFDFWEDSDWNKDVPPFFKRLNKIDDDRSFVILAASVLEYEIDRFLKVFIPDYKVLVTDRTNISTKINIVKAFKLIPTQLIDMADLVRNIRNDFAHNLEIDSFEDAHKSRKLPIHIENMKNIWSKYSNEMAYYHEGQPLRLMFKDIWKVSFEGFRVYETNIKLFRRETERPEYIQHLMSLSTELRIKREEKQKPF